MPCLSVRDKLYAALFAPRDGELRDVTAHLSPHPHFPFIRLPQRMARPGKQLPPVPKACVVRANNFSYEELQRVSFLSIFAIRARRASTKVQQFAVATSRQGALLV